MDKYANQEIAYIRAKQQLRRLKGRRLSSLSRQQLQAVILAQNALLPKAVKWELSEFDA